jgi:transcriptional regulator with XRE-family HTH domain
MATSNPKDQQAIEKLGLNVRRLRMIKGVTMVQLAADCNVEYTTISKIERGLLNTTISMISIIAKALEVHPAKLLED